MFLHHMTLAAVGPFAETVEIDFTTLGQSRLFLLDGPTGSGKSTIIDSIVFALYGRVASATTSDERMHSHFADSAVEPFVELIFETSAGIFRVRRTPTFERPKKRGTGTTSVNATIKLWRLATPEAIDGGELLTNRIDEAAAELNAVIGLNREQFSQTVVLPQGEFATFLKAPPEQRRDVLQRLFATEVFDAVSGKLEEQRRAARDSLVASDNAVAHAVTALRTAANIVEPHVGDLQPAKDDAELLALVNVAEHADARELARRRAAQAQAESRLSDALTKLDDAKSLVLRLDRRAELIRRETTLDARRETFERQGQLLATLRKVANVARTHENLVRARAHAEAAAAAFARSARDIPPAFAIGPDSAAVRAGELAASLSALQPALAAEEAMDSVQADAARLAAAVGETQAAVAALGELRLELPAEIESLAGQREQLRDVAHRAAELAALLAAANDRKQAADQSRTLAAEIAATERAATRAHASATAAAVFAGHRRQDRINGIAGELASGLLPGQCCPVCGATEHPQPAETGADPVSAADVTDAESAANAAADELAALRIVLDELHQRQLPLIARSNGLSRTAAQKAVQQHSQELTEAELAATKLGVIEAQLADRQTKLAEVDRQLEKLNPELAVVGKRAEDAQRHAAELASTVAKASVGYQSVAHHAASLRTGIDLAAQLLESRDRALAGATDAARQGAEFAALLAQFGIQDEATYVSYLPQLETIGTLESDIQDFAAQQLAIADALAAPDIANLTPAQSQDRPDIANLESNRDAAALERDSIMQQVAALARQAANVAKCARSVAEAVRQRSITRDAAQPIIRMADLVSANTPDNLLKMPLTTYVLLQRFRSVVAAANERLRSMSDGRYELAHTTEREDRGRKSGLGLVVIDHQTERERNPATLSGGECFYTSLSLALGLADVVTAEAGGMTLGTLFIDEGFGSLDPETLDDVLNEIAKLRDGGRVVGVVSHVEELKVRIPDRVEVRRTASGSSTVRVLC